MAWKLFGHATTPAQLPAELRDRKSTRLNSSHGYISYAVFCLKKKKITQEHEIRRVRDSSEQRAIAYPAALNNDYTHCLAFDNHYYTARHHIYLSFFITAPHYI